MSSSPQVSQEDDLLAIITFSRKMGNYLFLPIFVVFGCCTLFMLATIDEGWRRLLASRIFLLYICFTLFGFVFWKLSRKPRSGLFLVEGSILALCAFGWAAWILFAQFSPTPWIRVLPGVMWVMFVFVGIGAASIKCFQFWDALRRVDAASVEAALRSVADSRSRIEPPG
jgi:hypothetical protein